MGRRRAQRRQKRLVACTVAALGTAALGLGFSLLSDISDQQKRRAALTTAGPGTENAAGGQGIDSLPGEQIPVPAAQDTLADVFEVDFGASLDTTGMLLADLNYPFALGDEAFPLGGNASRNPSGPRTPAFRAPGWRGQNRGNSFGFNSFSAGGPGGGLLGGIPAAPRNLAGAAAFGDMPPPPPAGSDPGILDVTALFDLPSGGQSDYPRPVGLEIDPCAGGGLVVSPCYDPVAGLVLNPDDGSTGFGGFQGLRGPGPAGLAPRVAAAVSTNGSQGSQGENGGNGGAGNGNGGTGNGGSANGGAFVGNGNDPGNGGFNDPVTAGGNGGGTQIVQARQLAATPIPAPGSVFLLGLGALLLSAARVKRRVPKHTTRG